MPGWTKIERRRSAEYPGVGTSIVVPTEIWSGTLAELRAYGRARSEGLVFWGGVILGSSAQITGLYILRHNAQGGCVRVTVEETRWLLRKLRERDEKLIAQVHSHPGEAFHSAGDDERAASFHQGYISIVAPEYARSVQQPGDCAVFEMTQSGFTELNQREVQARIRLATLVEDRMPPAVDGAPADTLAGRNGVWPWLTTIVSNLSERLTGQKRR